MKISFDGSQLASASVITGGVNLMAQTERWWLGLILICIGTFIPGIKITSSKRKSRLP
jgi:hypothetical protein